MADAQAKHPTQAQPPTSQPQAQAHLPAAQPQNQSQPQTQAQSQGKLVVDDQPDIPGSWIWKESPPGSTDPGWSLTAELVAALKKSLQYIVDHSMAEAQPAATGAATAQAQVPAAMKDEAEPDAVHAHGSPAARSWLSRFFPSPETVDQLFAREHMESSSAGADYGGNYVIDRMTGDKFFESMPIYVRVGMHLLFVSGEQWVGSRVIETLLIDESIRQGKIYDTTGAVVPGHINSFIRAYSIPTHELLVQDISKYATFNSFFARRLVPTARPITSPHDPAVLTSPADCRLSVFEIKGQEFTVDNLLLGGDKEDKKFDELTSALEAGVAVCRLAPQDYHRFHSPFDAKIVYRKDIKGELYTVNPQAINEDLNVFTRNKRSVTLLHANLGPGRECTPAAFVAVGAMLVGSIGWSKDVGEQVRKGDELGWFQYGGSTCILVLPASAGVHFDHDLMAASEAQMETLVRVGMGIGKAAPVDPGPAAGDEKAV